MTRGVSFSVMRSLAAFVLFAGIGVGLFVYLPAPVDRNASLHNTQRLWAEANRSPSLPTIAVSTRSFSPDVSLPNPAPTKLHRTDQQLLTTTDRVDATVSAATPAVRTTLTGWQPVVANGSGRIKSGSGAASLKPKTATSRYKLVVEIQRDLKRRGCYWGRIDGSWGAGSKYAMQAFIDRINATLPIKEPDYLLLTLLQTNSDKTCGACPAGQTATVGGTCASDALVADAKRKSKGSGRDGAVVRSWGRTDTRQTAAQQLLRPVGSTIVTTAPLPGRMAIGGPTQLPPPSAEDYNEPDSVAASTFEDSNETRVSPRVIRRASAARRAPETRRKAQRQRRRYRGAREAQRRNLMIGLGGSY